LRPLARLRAALAASALRRARRHEADAGRTLRWLRLACLLAPQFGEAHRLLVARTTATDPMKGMAEARRWTTRFEPDSDAWVTLGTACRAAYRTRDALVAFERALQLDERPDAAFAAGLLYRMLQDHATAGARFARAYAAGGGSEALRENARTLKATGDEAAAQEAIRLWERETGERWAED
jgi:tetratricopeptide (TPR) repeat protein